MTTAALDGLLLTVGLLGTLLGVAAGEGGGSVLPLLAMLSGVDDQHVQPLAWPAGSRFELELSGGAQGGRSARRAEPEKQPTGIADVAEDRASGGSDRATPGGE